MASDQAKRTQDETEGALKPLAKELKEDDHADTESEEEERVVPSYPFPAEIILDVDRDTSIGVIPHLCARHKDGATERIVLFFPGVHGGVGPCRLPGSNFDEDALYPTIARRLAAEHNVDCYRCSWPFMRPALNYAAHAAMKVLSHAWENLQKHVQGPDHTDVKVIIVGHSLGGAVTLMAASHIAQYLEQLRKDAQGGERGGLGISINGFCTLNGAITPSQLQPNALESCRALLVAGDEDQIVPCSATASVFESLESRRKQHLVLPGGTHDLYTYKARLVDELLAFILEDGC